MADTDAFPFGSYDLSQMLRLLCDAELDPGLSGFVRPHDPTRSRLPIFDERAELAGFASPRQDEDGVWRMGAIYIRPSLRQRGLGTRAIADFMNGRRGRAFIEDENLASRGAFRAAGFRVVRSDAKKKGAWWENF